MNLSHLTLLELQCQGIAGNEDAVLELGKRVLDLPIHYLDGNHECEYRDELECLKADLETEIPDSCPNCDEWLTDQ